MRTIPSWLSMPPEAPPAQQVGAVAPGKPLIRCTWGALASIEPGQVAQGGPLGSGFSIAVLRVVQLVVALQEQITTESTLFRRHPNLPASLVDGARSSPALQILPQVAGDPLGQGLLHSHPVTPHDLQVLDPDCWLINHLPDHDRHRVGAPL
jgi:hypothetical protein